MSADPKDDVSPGSGSLARVLATSVPYAGSAALLKLGAFAVSLWLARTLSPKEFGTWGVAYAFQTALLTFGTVGIVEAVVGQLRHHPTPRERAGLFATSNRVFLLTLSLTVGICALLGVVFVGRQDIGLSALVGALLSGGLLAFGSLQAQFVRLEERHGASLAFSALVPFFALLGSSLGVVLLPRVDSFFAGSAVGALIAILALHLRRVAEWGDVQDTNLARDIVRRLPAYVAVGIFGWLSGYGSNLAVSFLFDSAEVARFTLALHVGAIVHLAATAMNQVWSPHFFRITHVEPLESVERKNRRFFLMQTLLLGLIAAGCLVVLPPALRWLGGNLSYYADMSWEMFLILCSYLVLSPWWHSQNYFFAYDKGQDLMKVIVATGIVGLALWVALMHFLGPMGIYAGFFVQILLRSVGTALVAARTWSFKIGWSIVIIGPLLASVGLMMVLLGIPGNTHH